MTQLSLKPFILLLCLLPALDSKAQNTVPAEPARDVTDAPLAPIAYFVSSTPGCYGAPVYFTDLSVVTIPPFGYITTWVWDMGDASPLITITFPNSPNIYHIFPYPGLFTVTLTVTDNYGNSDDYAADVLIYPAPLPYFVNTPGCEGQSVQFMDLSQTNGGGTITNWEWTFGDPGSGTGNTSSLQNPFHTFTGAGTFQVTLSITNSSGCVNGITLPVIVSPLSVGGSVSGSTTITFGQHTGTLTLTGQTGNVVKWQSQHDGGGYTDIPGTAGLTAYKETPIYPGTWDYRAVVLSGSCVSEYATPATVIVNDPPGGQSKTWTGIAGDDWNTDGNWSPPGVPGPPDYIVVPSSAPVMPVVRTNGLQCGAVTVIRGAVLTIDPGVTLTTDGPLTLE